MEILSTLPQGKKEYAGAIYAQEGPQGLLEYCYSTPVAGTQDNFAFAVEPGRKLAALWHNHIKGKDSDKHSANDITVAGALKRPSYIRDDATGDVRKFEPGVTPTTTIQVPGSRAQREPAALGALVGNPSRRDQIAAAYDLHTPPTKP